MMVNMQKAKQDALIKPGPTSKYRNRLRPIPGRGLRNWHLCTWKDQHNGIFFNISKAVKAKNWLNLNPKPPKKK
jgi:hypothetical protein